MDKNTAVALLIGAALGAGVVVATSTNVATAAPIDKVVTVKGSTAAMTMVCLRKSPDGSLGAQVHARAFLDDGGVGEEGIEDVTVPSDQAAIILNWMDGKGLALWRTARGLER